MTIQGLDKKYTATGTYMVAFIDVLGTKDKYKKNKEDCLQELWLITHIINKAIYNKKVIFRTFSDNFFIGIECSNNEDEAFDEICNLLGNITFRCLFANGIIMRGGVSKGTMHVDENIILGDALIRAHALESLCAVYTRIIIDRDAISLSNPDYSSKYKNGLYLDEDSIWCINTLKYADKEYAKARENMLKVFMLKQNIESRLNKDLKVKQKIDYYINYINNYYLENEGRTLIDYKMLEEIEHMSIEKIEELLKSIK